MRRHLRVRLAVIVHPPGQHVSGSSEVSQEKRNDGSVKYENYQRVLGEKRKATEEIQALRSRIADYESDEKRRKESELKKQNKYKELLELREKEAEEAKSELNEYLKLMPAGRDAENARRAIRVIDREIEK